MTPPVYLPAFLARSRCRILDEQRRPLPACACGVLGLKDDDRRRVCASEPANADASPAPEDWTRICGCLASYKLPRGYEIGQCCRAMKPARSRRSKLRDER
jgi:hypothetical protein